MANVLIEIAISEKKPEKVLYWYDQLRNNKRSWASVSDDRIAAAIQDYAPERAVSLWKTLAENLIHQTKPSAYEQAAGYLRKAGKIMKREKKQSQWNQYLNSLREKHGRKRRFIEILDQSDSKPIISKRWVDKRIRMDLQLRWDYAHERDDKELYSIEPYSAATHGWE